MVDGVAGRREEPSSLSKSLSLKVLQHTLSEPGVSMPVHHVRGSFEFDLTRSGNCSDPIAMVGRLKTTRASDDQRLDLDAREQRAQVLGAEGER